MPALHKIDFFKKYSFYFDLINKKTTTLFLSRKRRAVQFNIPIPEPQLLIHPWLISVKSGRKRGSTSSGEGVRRWPKCWEWEIAPTSPSCLPPPFGGESPFCCRPLGAAAAWFATVFLYLRHDAPVSCLNGILDTALGIRLHSSVQ